MACQVVYKDGTKGEYPSYRSILHKEKIQQIIFTETIETLHLSNNQIFFRQSPNDSDNVLSGATRGKIPIPLSGSNVIQNSQSM